MEATQMSNFWRKEKYYQQCIEVLDFWLVYYNILIEYDGISNNIVYWFSSNYLVSRQPWTGFGSTDSSNVNEFYRSNWEDEFSTTWEPSKTTLKISGKGIDH